MDYSFIYGNVFSFIAGCMTIFLLFRKRILGEVVSYNSFNKNRNIELDKLTGKFYALLSSHIDLTIYQNTVDAIELERQRIGTDMHDEMAAQLSSIYIDIEIINRESRLLSAEAANVLGNIRNKINDTVESLRMIIHGMLPYTLKHENLSNAVKELCGKHDGLKGTTVLFRTSGEPSPLNDQQKLYLYRIVQELLNNCFKHSKAWKIFVSIHWSLEELKIMIKDTGIGMPHFIEQGNKYGMTGIFIRSMIIGATSKFNSPIIGTEFELTLPLLKNQNLDQINPL